MAVWLSAAAITAAAACSDRTALERRAAGAPAQRLVGTWDVQFHMDRSPMLTMRPGSYAGKTVVGHIAFVANRWLGGSYPQIDRPTDYGTYDIDFTPFGFEPRSPGQTPTAVAGWVADDSVEIALGPDQSRTTVTLRGRLGGDSISGTWDVSVARAGAGGGRFRMSRQREP